ncbi:MAG: ATP-binding protein, partial [Weeksellaceae bacterium]|nr:ATP-binding protein [Weeksellaceae bacterium]
MSTNNFPIYPIEIIIYNKPDYLPLVCQILNTICEHHGFDTAKTQQIIMATEEAVSNVITHAFENEEATFSVIIHPISTGIKISIKDKGLPYNPEKTSFDENQMTGFGNFIIGKLMDNVVYKNLGHQGKELTLFKYFSTRHTELDKKIETKESDTISIEKKEKRPTYTYINRYLTPKDTLEVARCAYESYGYSYPYEHIYFPERVETLNKSGE